MVILQAGITGTYTVNDSISYTGGSTSLSTTTNATQQVTGAATTPLPNPMGAGEQQPFVFTYTNNSNAAVVIGAGAWWCSLPQLVAQKPLWIIVVCIRWLLMAGTCTVTGTFSSLTPSPPTYSVTSVLTLPGGSTVSVTTSSTGTILVTGAVTRLLYLIPWVEVKQIILYLHIQTVVKIQERFMVSHRMHHHIQM